jgi:hypothetical protein
MSSTDAFEGQTLEMGGPMRPRSASDWRRWWADGGERELRAVFREAWPPLAGTGDETCARLATRLATLLGSRAPLKALVAELGRMRTELGAEPARDEDAAAAERVQAWFPAGSVGGR